MYESILRVATKDPEFEFKCRNTPYPKTNVVTSRKVNEIGTAILFLLAVSTSLMVATIMG